MKEEKMELDENALDDEVVVEMSLVRTTVVDQ